TTFGNAVGGTQALGALTTDAGGTTTIRNVTTQGNVSFGDSVILAATNTTVSAGAGNVTFSGTVNATTFGVESLTVNSDGTTTFGDAVGSGASLASLTTGGAGSVSLKQVTTTGDQTYGNSGGVTLGGNHLILGSGPSLIGNFSVTGPTTLAAATVDV